MYQEISVWASGADCLQLRDEVDGSWFSMVGSPWSKRGW